MKLVLMVLVFVSLSVQGAASGSGISELTNQFEQVTGVKLSAKNLQLNGSNCRVLASATVDALGQRIPWFNLQTRNPKTWEVESWSFHLDLGDFTCKTRQVAANGEKVLQAVCTGQECDQGCATATYSVAVSKSGIKVGDSPVCRYR